MSKEHSGSAGVVIIGERLLQRRVCSRKWISEDYSRRIKGHWEINKEVQGTIIGVTSSYDGRFRFLVEWDDGKLDNETVSSIVLMDEFQEKKKL